MNDRTDEQLVELCKKDDELAFQELMRRYSSPIFRFARQYGKTTENAEDIAQDSFFKAWKHIRRFKTGKKFRPWLYTIARNTALDHIKKHRALTFSAMNDHETDLEFSDTLEDAGPLPAELFEQAESAARLELVLAEIHPDHRAVLVMHYQQELSFDEISEIVGKPMNTVKSWHRRALIKLRGLLAQQAAH